VQELYGSEAKSVQNLSWRKKKKQTCRSVLHWGVQGLDTAGMSTMFAKVVYRPHNIMASHIQDIPGKEQTYAMKIF
jgi:hypothetical protein